MRIFISSVIGGFERERAAAAAAVRTLGHEPILAETFGASPRSPQVTCLEGVRLADAVLLIMGARYGAEQASGLSATHEEFNEARERRPLLAFVQADHAREPRQDAFVAAVQDWQAGAYTAPFTSPEELQAAVISALHAWEIREAKGGPDPEEMIARARALLPKDQRGMTTGAASFVLAVAGGPRQPVLRPSELEDAGLLRDLHQMALFGPAPVFSGEAGVGHEVRGHTLTLAQDRPRRLLSIDEEGSLVLQLPLDRDRTGMPAILVEDLHELIGRSLRFSADVLDRVDRVQRLSQVAVAATLLEAGYRGWRTRAEHAASPNNMTMGRMSDEGAPVSLSPPHRPRTALRQQADRLAEDLVVLLRRRAQA